MGRKRKGDTSGPAITIGVTIPHELNEEAKELLFNENWSKLFADCLRSKISEVKEQEKQRIEELNTSLPFGMTS